MNLHSSLSRVLRPIGLLSTIATLFALLLAPAFARADTNVVGVLSATLTMSSGGSGSWHWDHFANPDGTFSGFDGDDALNLYTTGSVSYQVLYGDGQFTIGNILSSSGQQTTSGHYHNADWGEDADPPVTIGYVANPNFIPANMCSIQPGTDASYGQFIGTCEDVEYGEIDSNVYYSDGGGFPSDESWPPGFLGWSDGQACTTQGQQEVRQFVFIVPIAEGVPWTQTLATNAAVNWSDSDTWGGGSSGGATAVRTVTLTYTPGAPTVEFTATPVSGSAPLTVRFLASTYDSVGNSVEDYHLDFGDGTTSDKDGWVGEDHTYDEEGDYTVTLTCTNARGQFAAGVGPALIHVAKPTIAYSADRTSGDVKLTVNFSCPATDSGGEGIKQWNWDFGDDTTSSAQNPSHTYTNAGDFNVTLSVVNQNNETIKATGPATISVDSPTIHVSASPCEGLPGMTVLFNAPGMDSDGNLITQYAWTFGDSGKSTAQNPSHSYPIPGRYDTDLIATNSNGTEVSATGPEIVVAGYLGLVLNGDFETGDFFGWTNGGMMNYSSVSSQPAYVNTGDYGANLSAMFGFPGTIAQTLPTKAASTYMISFWLDNPPGNSANQFQVLWNSNVVWGVTNLTATGWTNVQLIVTAPGTNSVLQFSFQAMTSFGLDDVDVESAFVAVTATPTNGTAPLQVSFTSPAIDNNSDSITSWNWNFGDGGTSAAQNPSHTFLAAGRFIPHLTATTSNGVDVGIAPAIKVTAPTVQFAADSTAGAAPLTVHFTCPSTDSGTNSLTNWSWTFGDGATSTAQNPAHTYTNIGQFIPSLTVMDNKGVTIAAIGPSIMSLQPTGLVMNGGFETGDFNGWSGSGNFNAFVSTYFVHSGHWSAELVPNGSLGYLSENISTTAGKSYVLSFWLNSPDGQKTNEFSASWNGATLFHQTNLPAIGWTNMQFAVTATGASTPLQFGFRDDNSYLALDDVSVIAPTVQVTGSPTNGPAPLLVRFQSPSVDSVGNTLTGWSWSFGDGLTSAGQNPVHVYTNTGNFQPTCVVTNSAGLGMPIIGPAISVAVMPTVQFTASPLIGGAPLPVQFACPTLASDGSTIAHWHWDFGDGSTSTSQNPSHTYATSGNFSPALLATNSGNQQVAATGPTISVISQSGLVTNGDFETGNFFAWTLGGMMNYSSVSSSSQFVHTLSCGTCLLGSYGPPGDSNFLSQVLSTTPGTSYLLSFWLDSPNSYSSNEFIVTWGGAPVFDQMIGSLAWTNIQVNVSATTNNTPLKFVFTGMSPFGLDDISAVVSARPKPCITSIALQSGTNLMVNATNGQSGATYCVMMTTNLSKPVGQWTPVSTNCLSTGGAFSITATNAIDPHAPQRFFILQAH